MTAVQNLLERTIAELKNAGLNPYFINGYHEPDEHKHPEGIQLNVKETFRVNNTLEKNLENVTVTIEVTNWTNEGTWATGKCVAKIKVPKDASDKVIKNRVAKVLEYYK